MAKAWIERLPRPVQQKLAAHPSLRKILVNISWLLIDNILNIAVSIVIGAWVARYLGPDQWGMLGYAISFVGLFVIFANLGLDYIVVRAIVRKDAPPEQILGTAFSLSLVAALVTYGVAAAIIWQINSDPLIRILVLIAAGNIILQPFNMINLWFQSQIESKYVVWVKNLALFLNSGFKITLILGQMPVIAFAWAAILQQIVVVIGWLWMFSRRGPRMNTWRPRWAVARALLHEAWPMIISGIATSVYMKIDQVILGSILDTRAVGIYGAAVRLSELWYFVPMALAASLFPTIIRSRHLDETTYQRRIQAFYDLMAGLGFLVAIFNTLFALPLIHALFGPAYSASTPILQIHTWATVFICLGLARTRWLLAEDFAVFLTIAPTLGAITNVLLNLWLIPTHGGLGAAWATVISYATSAYLSCLLTPRLWPVFRQLTLSLLIPFRVAAIRRSIQELI